MGAREVDKPCQVLGSNFGCTSGCKGIVNRRRIILKVVRIYTLLILRGIRYLPPPPPLVLQHGLSSKAVIVNIPFVTQSH